MIFKFWKKRAKTSRRKRNTSQRATASFGGMQERVTQARLEILVETVLTRHRSALEHARALSNIIPPIQSTL